MHNSAVNLKNPRSAKPLRPGGQLAGVHWTGTDAGRKEALGVLGMEIAQTALQSIGMSSKDPWGRPPIHLPEYALAVSLIFTKATNQTIILNTPPEHVLSTSILWSSLAHDKRFEQVPMNEAAPGDIIIGSGWQQGADGYAGIIVGHGRIVSNSSGGVQDNSSLSEIQRSHPAMAAFRYVGFWNYYRSKPFANTGFDPNEPRLPAGQPGGGQWTKMEMAPSTAILSGGNRWTDPAAAAPAKVDDRNKQAQRDNSQQTTKPAVTEAEELKTLWAPVVDSINAEAQHPTRAQLERFGKAFDALQKYLVDHGMTPEEAFEAVYGAVHSLTQPGSGPNPGSEGVLGTYLGKSAGADIAQIFATVIIGRSSTPDKSSNSQPTALKPYSEDGGHHIPAKKAFEDDPAYNPNDALAIPNAELESLGLRHSKITGAQKTLYSAYAKQGKPLTWDAVESIETRALIKSGLDPGRAAATVRETIKALIASGVKVPTRIPWGGK